MKRHTCRSEIGAHTAWWEGVAPHHRQGLFLHENGICPECSSDLRRIDYLRRGEGGQTPKHHERRGVEEGSVQCSHATVNRVRTRCLKETEIMNTETVSRVVFILSLDLLTQQVLGNHSLMETRIICLVKQGQNLRSKNIKLDLSTNVLMSFSNKLMLKDWNWRTPIAEKLKPEENNLDHKKNYLWRKRCFEKLKYEIYTRWEKWRELKNYESATSLYKN